MTVKNNDLGVTPRLARPFASERLRKLAREGSWVVLGQVMAVIGSLVGVKIMTSLMPPESYGRLALGMTLATLLNQIVIGPFANGVTRFYSPANEKADLHGYMQAVRRITLSLTRYIAALAFVACAGLLVAGQARWSAIVATALTYAVLTGYNSVLSGIQNAARQRSVVALHQGMEPWVRFIVVAALLVWVDGTSYMALAGYAIAVVPVLASQYIFYRRIAPQNTDQAADARYWQDQIWRYSWPFASWGLFTWAQMASDRWAIETFASTQEVGQYAALLQLGYYPMTMATGMLVQLLAPIFFQRAGDASDAQRNAAVNSLTWRLTWLALGFTGIGFLIANLLHKQVFALLLTSKYAPVSHLLPWMFLSGGLFAAGQTISLNLMSQMKTRAIAVGKVVTAVLGVLLNFLGAYLLGMTGVVLAGVSFSFLYLMWMVALSRRDRSNVAYATGAAK